MPVFRKQRKREKEERDRREQEKREEEAKERREEEQRREKREQERKEEETRREIERRERSKEEEPIRQKEEQELGKEQAPPPPTLLIEPRLLRGGFPSFNFSPSIFEFSNFNLSFKEIAIPYFQNLEFSTHGNSQLELWLPLWFPLTQDKNNFSKRSKAS